MLAFVVRDIPMELCVSYEEIISEDMGNNDECLNLWIGYHQVCRSDFATLLLRRASHANFVDAQSSLSFSEKLKLVRWARQIQTKVIKANFKKKIHLNSVSEPDGQVKKNSPNERPVISFPKADSVAKASSTGETNSEAQSKGGNGAFKIHPLGDSTVGGYVGQRYGESELKVLERVSYKPININNNYHKGHLYYPVLTVRQQSTLVGERYVIQECLEAVVVRSDRMVLNIEESNRPDGSVGGKILRLSDGTLIQKRPTSNGHGSWEWDSIQDFLVGRHEKTTLNNLLSIIHRHLYSRVWLPEECDYWMLALAVVVTYTQAIFDSVPLFLLTGPAGSGKSELSGSMAEVSANSVMIGQTSAPTMMRLIDESGGLVIIDDLESVGVSTKGGKGESVSDIAQALKVSYKKSSATRLVTDTRTMRTEILNFYGVKIISNTSSVGEILGSRMLHIYTRHMPEGMEEFKAREKVLPDVVREVRNQLHIWAFENVAQIRETYLSMYSDKTNRDDEIAAPLRVIAYLTGDAEIVAQIEAALSLQASRKADPYSPEELVMEALETMVLNGYRSFTITHLMLEMRRMAEPNLGKDTDNEIPLWNKPEWVGRYLRSIDVLSVAKKDVRKRIKGSNLRVSSLTTAFVKSVLIKHKRSFTAIRDVSDFCGDCKSCPFSALGCEIMLQMKA
jgi:hypothetical protein